MRTAENGAVSWTNIAVAALAVLLGNALLIASAKTQIPFWPVPMTLQTLVAVLLGFAMGPRLGVATVGLYLLEGAAGLPVFAGTPERGIGIAYMAGPTGGYLAGFIAAAWLSGQAAALGWARTWATRALTIAASFLVIYALGVAWLSSFIGFGAAVKAGVVPFLLGDAIKLALGVLLVDAIGRTRGLLSGR
jgi:biotin transport system substrate-specific component